MTLSSMQQQAPPKSIFDVARSATAPPPRPAHTAALHRIFHITSGHACATVGPALGTKFSMERDNKQLVVSVSNRWTLEQVWWNEARTQKPQTFSSKTGTGGDWREVDPTDSGKACDFCQWQTMTATDPGFQRVENQYTVTASNLFKYAEPCHGLVLFKHHDPLDFSLERLGDLLDASINWFRQSAQAHAAATTDSRTNGSSSRDVDGAGELEPFLLWNCLPRAGASQFHGHAQVMLTATAVPQQRRLRLAAEAYTRRPHTHIDQQRLRHSNSDDTSHCYYADLLKAHEALGLLQACSTSGHSHTTAATRTDTSSLASPLTSPAAAATAGTAGAGADRASDTESQADTAWAFASLVPAKDMELVVAGSHLGSPALRKMLHAAMRALIDRLGVRTFNVGVLNLRESLELGTAANSKGQSQHGAEASRHREGNGMVEGVNGSTATTSSSSSSSSIYSTNGSGVISDGSSTAVPGRFARPPVLVRVVSRGKVGAPASDYGGLEVFGGASIGHTDPYIVAAALQQQLACYTQ